MSEEQSGGGLHIDSDWKEEARREKEQLAAQEAAARRAGQGAAESAGVALSFFDLVNVLAMQAAVGLGGLQGPGGERIPPNLQAAKHHIDLLDVLNDKTKGNLTDEEKRVLDSVLYELRMQFVHMVSGPPPHGPGADPSAGAGGTPR